MSRERQAMTPPAIVAMASTASPTLAVGEPRSV